MADFLLRGVDELTAERLRGLSRDRNASVAEVVLELVKEALAARGPAPVQTVVYKTISEVDGAWEGDESDAFREALEALDSLPPSDGLFGCVAAR